MYKTHLEQIRIFPIRECAAVSVDSQVNDFVIMKFAQCGNYPEIIAGGDYIAVIWKELVETSYDPAPREFARINTSGIPDDWKEREKKWNQNNGDMWFTIVFGAVVVLMIVCLLVKFKVF